MSIRAALLHAYLEKYGSYVIGLVSTVVISRLLSPADVGAFAVGMALVGIVAVLRELGISTYVVQERELTVNRIRAAFTITVGIGFVLALLVAALAVPVASFYGDDRLQEILWILAFGFAITPLGSVSQSLLTRALRFGVLAWIRLTHALVMGVVGAWLAWRGLGPQSLAWATATAAVTNAAISYWTHPHPVWPIAKREDLSRVFSIGVPTALVAIVDDLINTIPDLIVGRLQGLAAAGLLSRAKGLSQSAQQLIVRGAGPVFLSVYSDIKREGGRVESLYVKASACVCAVGWTLLAVLAVLAQPVVQLLYGPQWIDVVPLLRALCAAAAALLLTSGSHILLLAHDGARDALHAKLWALPWYLACAVIGSVISLEALAYAYVIASIAASGLMARALRRRVGIGIKAQLLPLQSSTLPAIGAGLACLPIAFWYAHSKAPTWAALTIGLAAAAIGGAMGLAARDSPLRAEVLRWWRTRAAIA